MVEDLLSWTTYDVKLGRSQSILGQAGVYFEMWLVTLEDFKQSNILSERGLCDASILRVCSKMYFALLRPMDLDDETIFDAYNEIYQEIGTKYR